MSQDRWTEVDNYFNSRLLGADPVLEAALQSSAAAGLPSINVAANQGRLLQLLAQIHGAKKILEIGTLGGYSTIWMARALPADGRLISLEISPKHAEVAKANIARAGLESKVQIRVAPALETLPKLLAEGAGPFDLIFIDADKPSIPDYFQWSLKLSRPGTVIIADNVVRKGAVADASSRDESVLGVRRFVDMVAAEPHKATVLQTVGTKGYDGLAVVVIA